MLTFVVSRPGDLPATRVRLSWPGGSRAVELGPGARQTVSVEVPRGLRRAWTLSIEAEPVALLGDWRPVVARVSGPRLEVASREASRLAV